MNAQDLKNSILQLAVQGKLVEQRPEEGTAKELLAQIKAEKEQLIKDKKIKKEKPLPEITEKEIPFEIPESWEWVRLGDICIKLVDGDHNPPKGVDMITPYILASSTNINNNTIVELEKVRYLTQEIFEKENERTNAQEGDIFFTSVGTLGRSCVYKGGYNICFQRSVSVLRTLVLNYYLKYMFDSAYFQYKVTREATGTAQKGFYLNQLAVALVPVPPLAEQKRIVAKIEELLLYIEQYDRAYTKLEAFNKKFPEDMKKSILQMAMQGKLVEQHPEEGTADELYEQIVAEKARLIKEGKIKKEKPLAEITKDEIPFEIPASWKWVKLGNIIKEVIVPQRDKPLFSKEGIPWCRIEDRDGVLLNGSKSNQLVSQETIQKMNLRVLPVGAVLSACTGGSIGTIVINTVECCTNQTFNAIVCSSGLYNWYLFWFLTSKFSELRRIGTGTTMAYISQQKTKDMVIPLPPLAEQKRIVAKLEQMLPYCDQLIK